MNKIVKLTAIAFLGTSLVVGGLNAAAVPVAGDVPAVAVQEQDAVVQDKVAEQQVVASTPCTKLHWSKSECIAASAGIASAACIDPKAAVALVIVAVPTWVACKLIGAAVSYGCMAYAAIRSRCGTRVKSKDTANKQQ